MKALYRKYRPRVLSEVVGQDQVVKPLLGSLKSGKISHAYLFIGPRGCGKTTVARIMAHEVNGFNYELEDDYVDIIEIDGASNRGIDNIRELREKAMIAPTSGKYKVYIIDEVHMLTKEAFNALLKTLEEPPAHVIFIMATTDAYKVPVTITSRTQTFTFKLADKPVMHDFLKSVSLKEGIKISDDALDIIVKRGGGSFRDSLSLLDQISSLSDKEITKELVVDALGLPEDEKINNLLEQYINGDINGITSNIKDLLSSGIKPETLAEELMNAIIENPRPELVPLLSKLIEIKSPFAEARLLVALMTSTFGAFASNSGSRPAGPSPWAAGANSSLRSHVPRGERAAALRNPLSSDANAPVHTSSLSNQATILTKEDKTFAMAPATTVISNASVSSFDWDEFLQKVKSLNDAIYSQLLKTEHIVSAGMLDIYPSKKIVYTILSRDNNKKILINAASGVKITIHSADDKPNNLPKNETLAKISDIMGGEVINDGGENPF